MPCTAEVLLTPCCELLCYCWDHGLYCCGTIGTMSWSAAQYSCGTIDEWDYALSCYGTINTMKCVLWHYWRHAMYIDDTKPYTAVILWRHSDTMSSISVVLLTPCEVYLWYCWHNAMYTCGTIDTMPYINVLLLTPCHVYMWYIDHHAMYTCNTIDPMPCIPVVLTTP